MTNSIIARPVLPIDQLAGLILNVGQFISLLLQGEPGVGKTSVLAELAKLNGDKWRKPGDYYPEDKCCYILIIGPQLDVLAFGSPMPNMETKTIEMFIGGLLQPLDPRPHVILIDEVGKIPNILKAPVRNLQLEKSVQGYTLPEGSIVVATTNNPADGLGDIIKAHEGNAISIIQTTKPTLEGWLAYAQANGVSALTCTTVSMFPTMFDSYVTHDVSKNPYVFDPAKRMISFVSPRSLVKNDRAYVQNRHLLTHQQLLAGMTGTIGQAAAQAFAMMLEVEKEIYPADLVLKDPQAAPIPSSIAAKLFMLFQSFQYLTTQETLAKYMEYVMRWQYNELEGVFAHGAQNHPTTKPFAHRNPKLNEWKKHETNFQILQSL